MRSPALRRTKHTFGDWLALVVMALMGAGFGVVFLLWMAGVGQ
jgi:hypothetical protein